MTLPRPLSAGTKRFFLESPSRSSTSRAASLRAVSGTHPFLSKSVYHPVHTHIDTSWKHPRYPTWAQGPPFPKFLSQSFRNLQFMICMQVDLGPPPRGAHRRLPPRVLRRHPARGRHRPVRHRGHLLDLLGERPAGPPRGRDRHGPRRERTPQPPPPRLLALPLAAAHGP